MLFSIKQYNNNTNVLIIIIMFLITLKKIFNHVMIIKQEQLQPKKSVILA